MSFSLSCQPIDIRQLAQQLNSSQAGAFVSFEGRVRDHNEGRNVVALEYEAVDELCHKEALKILDEARLKFGVIDVQCVHRVGRLSISDVAVWIGVIAAHRQEAFEACRFIIDEIKHRLPIWKKEYYTDGNSGWVHCDHGSHSCCHANENEYFRRQILLKDIGREGQDKLKKARVLVVGAGGLGCPALISLATSGVGTIGMCDFDRVELSNLHRQTLYTPDDLGKPKVDVAARRIAALAPFVHVQRHTVPCAPENVEQLISNYDIVLDGTDQFSTKFLLNDACRLAGKILISSSIYQYDGQLRVLTPSAEGCLRCLWPEIPPAHCVNNCADAGVLGIVPSVFGHLMALEAVKCVIQTIAPLTNTEILSVDLGSLEMKRLKVSARPDCPLCGSSPEIASIDSQNYESQQSFLLSWEDIELNDDSQLVVFDVREDEERQVSPVPEIKATPLPMSRTDFARHDFPKNKTVALFCSKGTRSARIVEGLRDKGRINIFSVEGGLEKLSRRLNNPQAKT